ncbi:hypothetical protein H2200_008787 [Cladophialophora chaetospira]|uniref:CCZ1/INTU/HSP4 first Longin domain-containing protein n=1 Tax=Cladophialophora chaetospira TaxID=386627 RepID=A0AA38X505_9EURO|nr:hypothetical protein H2200_008787 [Cladophialophora chaetospira]
MSNPAVVPAHLSYFAIYNPTLGPTDETVRDQIVFYYSRRLELEHERRGKEKRVRAGKDETLSEQDVGDAEENERLRQVGLAQGMVNFVKNFSNGFPLETVETEKSRVVLKELEPDWWILAAVDLTQLPATNRVPSTSSSVKSGRSTPSVEPTPANNIEYSSREVAPAPLLLTQLVQAQRLFLLHHASSLSELWKRHENKRELFCNLLQRYWTRFIWNWDVLLHGNPSVDLYNATKLAGGGELGVGVGEEEWGSGEREVLEGFAARTDGLVDLIVGRYGDVPPPARSDDKKDTHIGKVSSSWLGNGESPGAEDGIIFGGIGGISQSSRTTVSHWMESIYMLGDGAYGVLENPSALPRHRKKRRKVVKETSEGLRLPRSQHQAEAANLRVKSPAAKGPDLRRKAMANNSTSPGIPAPIVTAVERSLDNALAKADAKTSAEDHDTVHRAPQDSEHNITQQDSMFNAEKMMKYLSLGYGSSWTLNPKGFNVDNSPQILPEEDKSEALAAQPPTESQLQELDPTPEVSEEDESPFIQRLEESMGKFLIGLSGDLENMEFEDGSNDERSDKATSNSSTLTVEAPKRIFLRTLTMEMSTNRFCRRTSTDQRPFQQSRGLVASDNFEGKTSAGASVDGAQPVTIHEKVQVAVYVHQPFIFVFLFQLHTPNLTVPGFYRAIHHTLGPLQKSLLRSTDIQRWTERIRGSLVVATDPSGEDGGKQPLTPESKDINEIYDLLYDPAKSTIRTSIPNIPIPGSLAAEGLHRSAQSVRPITVSGSWYTLGIPISPSSGGSTTSPGGAATLVKSRWTRIEALNVHTHIMATWSATRDKQGGLTHAQPHSEDQERTIKTNRGWWVVWMKVPSTEPNNWHTSRDCAREAVLVRRSPQERSVSSMDASQSRSETRSANSAGRWLLRDQPRSREVSGTTASPGAANAKGFTEGVGVDARKWVEALIRLSD